MTRSVRAGGRVLLMSLLVLTLVVSAGPAEARQDQGAEQQFISLINADRTGAGLGSLMPVADVRSVALAWSNHMATTRIMAHNPVYHEQFCCWRRAAENVGWTTVSNMDDPAVVRSAVQRLHTAFMDSPGHRHNLMNPAYDHIGLAIEMRANSCPVGTSIRDCMWVTENFREWNGTPPAGGLRHAYEGSDARGSTGGDTTDVKVSDKVRRGGFDGNRTTVERLGRTADSSLQVSRARFGADEATHAVVSRRDRFPDALAGTPLTSAGPLLLTPRSGLTVAVKKELARVLPAGATVYVLGGEDALHGRVESQVRGLGLRPVRLSGPTRVDTALEVAKEVRRVHGDTGMVAVARATGVSGDPDGPTGWVDSVTGGAWAASRGIPVVISPTDRLPGSVARWLAQDAPRTTVLLGGDTALSDRVQKAVPNGTRIWGQDRTGTAVAVATRLWGVSRNSSDRQFVVVDGWARDGWRHGLSAAGLAADEGAPLLLTRSDPWQQPAPTSDLVGACDTPSVDLLLVGDLADSVAGALERLDGRTC